MSLTEPPVEDDNEIEPRPSRRFTILFWLAILAIAVGYMWVWQAKTTRVVAEPPPGLVLRAVTSRVSGPDSAAAAAVRDTVAAHLLTVPDLVLLDAVPPPDPAEPRPDRPPRRVFALGGALDRDRDGRYSLELRRTDARTDSLVYIYRVAGPSLTEVAHRMAVQVAMSFGLALPRPGAVPARDSTPAQIDTAH